MSFVFFDTETTGLRQGFDQIVHFAAIQTDAELNEIDRFEARSRLLPYVVPHPSALEINRLSIEQLGDPELASHYEMVCQIQQQLLAWSPTIFVGYNSIRFDEEMLRQALFQTLHPVFLTSNHRNCRADVLGLVMAAASLSQACLVVPFGPEGRPTFRLDQLAPANAIVHDRAHDAIADVAATLQLCRCVRDRAPELWQRFVRFSKKATVADFVEAEDAFILTEFFANQAYHTPVVCIGRDPDQINGRLCLSLAIDPGELESMPDEILHAEFARKPSPIRRLRINAAPTVTALYEATAQLLSGLDVDELEARARRVKQAAALCHRLIAAYTTGREPRLPSPHPEKRIYDGFPECDDESRMAAFHDATWPERVLIVERFDDERLRTFGRRLIYSERRSALPANIRAELDETLSERLLEDRGGPLTLGEALRETDVLLESAVPNELNLLTNYRGYLVDRIQRVTDFRRMRLGG